MVQHVGWQGPGVGSAWVDEVLWQGPLLGLLGLARAKGSLSGWGRELRRWGAVREMRRSRASWAAGMLGMQTSCLLECWVDLLC